MPPNPPSNAHGFAMRSMSLRDMQIPKSEKKIFLAPPLPNPGNAPAKSHTIYGRSFICKRKGIGTKTVPCGTPESTHTRLEDRYTINYDTCIVYVLLKK